MASKRRWREWPRRFANELNGMSGIATLGGTVLSILAFVGGSATSSRAAAIIGWGGAAIAVVAMVIAGWNAIPPRLKEAAGLIGHRVNLSDLKDIYPQLLKLSVVGPASAGKSTLANMIRNEPAPNERTQGIHAYITSLQTIPIRYMAILDGSGQSFADQFAVAAEADVLCVILDHNGTDKAQAVNQQRLQQHEEFLGQLLSYMKSQRNTPLPWAHIVLNKRDLWEAAPEEDRQRILAFLSKTESAWTNGYWAKKVTTAQHSNRYAADVGAFLRQIVVFIDSHK